MKSETTKSRRRRSKKQAVGINHYCAAVAVVCRHGCCCCCCPVADWIGSYCLTESPMVATARWLENKQNHLTFGCMTVDGIIFRRISNRTAFVKANGKNDKRLMWNQITVKDTVVSHLHIQRQHKIHHLNLNLIVVIHSYKAEQNWVWLNEIHTCVTLHLAQCTVNSGENSSGCKSTVCDSNKRCACTDRYRLTHVRTDWVRYS